MTDRTGPPLRARQALLIDGTNLAHRCYHALPALSAPDGTPTHVLHGFVGMVERFLRELHPVIGAIAFDGPGHAPWRLAKHPDYKKRGKPRPEDLTSQLARLPEVTPLMGFATFCHLEADDLLGILTDRVLDETDLDVVIVSSDKDFAQLVDDRTRLLRPGGSKSPDECLGPDEVLARWGVRPDQFPDWLGLVGDKSDNIPGVKGVGEGKATKLLTDFGNLDQVYENLDGLTPGLQKNLLDHRADAFLSRDLAYLDPDAVLPALADGSPVPLTLGGNPSEFQRYVQSLGFRAPGGPGS